MNESCQICNDNIEAKNIWLCKLHAVVLSELIKQNKIIHKDEINFSYHCQICGEWEGRKIVEYIDKNIEYGNYGFFCEYCVEKSIVYYNKNKED